MHRPTRPASLLLALALLCGSRTTPAAAASEWLAGGTPLCRAPGAQLRPTAIADGTGGAIVVWEDQSRSHDATTDLYAQRVTAEGLIADGWPADGLAICTAVGSQLDPMLCTDGDGGAFIAWYDLRVNHTVPNGPPVVFVQHVRGDGTLAPGWPMDGMRIATIDELQLHPRIASDGVTPGGGCFVTWQDGRGAAPGIYVQHLTTAGTPAPGWPANGRALSSAGGSFPDIVADGAAPGPGGSGALVAWYDPAYAIRVQRVTASGDLAAGWPANGALVSSGPTYKLYPRLLADGAGGAFLAWSDFSAFYASLADLYLQRVTGAGTLAPGWSGAGVPLCTAPETQQQAGLVPDGAGGVLAVWTDYRDHRGQVFLQRVGSGGAPAWAADGIPLTSSTDDQGGAAAVADGAGGVIVVWSESSRDSIGIPTGRAFALRVTSAGVPAPGWPAQGVAICGPLDGQGMTGAVGDGAGGIITVWDDLRDYEAGAGNSDIYAARVLADGSVPARLALVGAQAALADDDETGHARLVWLDPELAVASATVYRRTGSEDWAAVGSVSADGQGRMVYEDGTVLPGRPYSYRLGWTDEGGPRYGGEGSVTVPAPAALRLAGARPNPAVTELSVRLTLPAWSEARLELYDVAGRKVRSVPLALGPGAHTVSLGPTAQFEPGVYFLHLTQGSRTLTRRVTLLR